jgi:hypothetical protein
MLDELESAIKQQRATINHKLDMLDKYYKNPEDRPKVQKYQAEIIRFMQEGEYLYNV